MLLEQLPDGTTGCTVYMLIQKTVSFASLTDFLGLQGIFARQ